MSNNSSSTLTYNPLQGLALGTLTGASTLTGINELNAWEARQYKKEGLKRVLKQQKAAAKELLKSPEAIEYYAKNILYPDLSAMRYDKKLKKEVYDATSDRFLNRLYEEVEKINAGKPAFINKELNETIADNFVRKGYGILNNPELRYFKGDIFKNPLDIVETNPKRESPSLFEEIRNRELKQNLSQKYKDPKKLKEKLNSLQLSRTPAFDDILANAKTETGGSNYNNHLLGNRITGKLVGSRSKTKLIPILADRFGMWCAVGRKYRLAAALGLPATVLGGLTYVKNEDLNNPAIANLIQPAAYGLGSATLGTIGAEATRMGLNLASEKATAKEILKEINTIGKTRPLSASELEKGEFALSRLLKRLPTAPVNWSDRITAEYEDKLLGNKLWDKINKKLIGEKLFKNIKNERIYNTAYFSKNPKLRLLSLLTPTTIAGAGLGTAGTTYGAYKSLTSEEPKQPTKLEEIKKGIMEVINNKISPKEKSTSDNVKDVLKSLAIGGSSGAVLADAGIGFNREVLGHWLPSVLKGYPKVLKKLHPITAPGKLYQRLMRNPKFKTLALLGGAATGTGVAYNQFSS